VTLLIKLKNLMRKLTKSNLTTGEGSSKNTYCQLGPY
jgi:hypothetical protein